MGNEYRVGFQPPVLRLVTDVEPVQEHTQDQGLLFGEAVVPPHLIDAARIEGALVEYRTLLDEAQEHEEAIAEHDRAIGSIHDKLGAIERLIGEDFQTIFDQFDAFNFEPTNLVIDDNGGI